MKRRSQREFLEAQLSAVTSILESLAPDALLERLGFEDRLATLSAALATEGDSAKNFAHARLIFGGDPVAEAEGIEARFAADALSAYQDLVSKTLAAPVTLNSSGPIPFERQSRLHITDVVRGSFGFELDEVQEQDSFTPTPLRLAVEQVASLVFAAARSDDEFLDAVVDTHPRVRDSLRHFINTIYKANATIGIETWDATMKIDAQTIELANERVSIEWRDEAHLEIRGVFKGVLHVSRAFEHRAADGSLVKGKADPSVDLTTLDGWIDRPCAAQVKQVSWQRAGKQFARYTLLGLLP